MLHRAKVAPGNICANHCAACLPCAVQEKEIESLAGKKEGCHDDVEFITVERNKTLPAGSNARPAALPSSTLLQPLSTSSVDLGHPAEVRAAQGKETPSSSLAIHSAVHCFCTDAVTAAGSCVALEVQTARCTL